MSKLRARTWVAVAFLGLAASMVAVSASASTCQVFSNGWDEGELCHGTDGWGGGSIDSSGNKVLWVSLQSGSRALARGLASNGSQVSTCGVVDTSPDLNSVSDSSGCNAATHFVLVHDSF
jgi:hypothetical protein